MNTQKPYIELVAQAEKAVSGVKDPELRRVAFEKILDDLLLGAGGASRPQPQAPSAHSETTHAAKHKPSGRPKAKLGGPQNYVQELIDDGFFAKPKTIAQVKAELENLGHHIPVTSLSGPLQRLCQKKSLRRQKTDGTFGYSKW